MTATRSTLDPYSNVVSIELANRTKNSLIKHHSTWFIGHANIIIEALTGAILKKSVSKEDAVCEPTFAACAFEKGRMIAVARARDVHKRQEWGRALEAVGFIADPLTWLSTDPKAPQPTSATAIRTLPPATAICRGLGQVQISTEEGPWSAAVQTCCTYSTFRRFLTA